MANQIIGTVKWFNIEKGFGFIQLEDNSKDLFFHHNEIKNSGYVRASLNEGQRVTFNIGTNQKGEYATNIETL